MTDGKGQTNASFTINGTSGPKGDKPVPVVPSMVLTDGTSEVLCSSYSLIEIWYQCVG